MDVQESVTREAVMSVSLDFWDNCHLKNSKATFILEEYALSVRFVLK